MEYCPLCISTSRTFFRNEFLICSVCHGIFRPAQFLPEASIEKNRYLEHNNDVKDLGYRNFVQPLVDSIRKNYTPEHTGLDYGAGPGPVGAAILQELGYIIDLYDPFFHNNVNLLEKKYDYILCCEVIEHFHKPAKEFLLLKNLLKENGILFIMTHIYEPEIFFDNWYYKNDCTHVFIYQKQTIEWIKKNFEFGFSSIEGKVIRLGKTIFSGEAKLP